VVVTAPWYVRDALKEDQFASSPAPDCEIVEQVPKAPAHEPMQPTLK
jgi:hypothetical protein